MNRSDNNVKQEPLLYYKTREDIQRYKKLPIRHKFEWLEAQMEFFYYAMPEKAKKIRDKIKRE